MTVLPLVYKPKVIHLVLTENPDCPRRWKTQAEVFARIKELRSLPPLRIAPTGFAMKYRPSPNWKLENAGNFRMRNKQGTYRNEQLRKTGT